MSRGGAGVASLVVAVCVAGLAGCAVGTVEPSRDPGSDGTTSVQLTVFGAASLTGVLERLREAYADVAPGTSIVISTDSSAALATQIEQGAPADVFLSADQEQPRRLSDGGLTVGPPVSFAANGLAVITPLDDPGGIATPADLARPGVTVIAAGEQVPITAYATRLVERLATQPGYPADFATAYAANIATREDNVQAVLAKIELGEGDAGIVYRTDALASGRVRGLEVPDAAQVMATYDGVVIAGSAHVQAARDFLAWLRSSAGQAILADDGFLPAR